MGPSIYTGPGKYDDTLFYELQWTGPIGPNSENIFAMQ